MAPNSRGTVVLAPHVPPSSLEDLEGFSHLCGPRAVPSGGAADPLGRRSWLIFVFDRNTNVGTKRLGLEMVPGRQYTPQGKVAPPVRVARCGGAGGAGLA